MPAPLVVGFDLDLTLIDSRPGIAAALRRLAAETGIPVDADLVVTRLGPPIEQELARWFPAHEVDAAGDGYRRHYEDTLADGTAALPGAAAALAAVRANGGRVVVVTAKRVDLARRCLAAAGLAADDVVGSLWGAGKGIALREHGATIYVGDHPLDVEGARVGECYSVAVASGGTSRGDLAAAGADIVLDDLAGFPGWLDQHVLDRRLDDLDASLRALDAPLVVAFSGGADSAFLLAAAVRALGPERVVAATAVSPSLPEAELTGAQAFAASLGVRHLMPGTNELAREGYAANAGDRCYFCKTELIEVLLPVAAELDARIATGTNADDVRAGFRPGIRAAAERGAITPLLDAGLTKAQIRAASQRWELPTWNKPAAACLSSRIAYGIRITPHRLARVEHAERSLREALREAGHDVRNLRVRDLGEVARVEVDRELVPFVDGAALESITGFERVEVDPRGFRSGSMNELLAEPSRYR